MPNASELIEAARSIERTGQDYTTSFFATPARIEAWCASGTLSMLQCARALVVLRRDGELVRVHHIASNEVSLSTALGALIERMRDSVLVADLVGKPGDLGRIIDVYRSHGFVPYARLIRMHRLGPDSASTSSETGAEVAGPEDVPRLHAFMRRWLDPLSEQIQDVEQLRESVDMNAVLVVRQGRELAGILIHETVGLSTQLRYWHVAGNQHGQGIGSRLMRTFLARCASSRRISLWVIANNANAIARYHHYGFREDGLVDEIMVRQPKQATK